MSSEYLIHLKEPKAESVLAALRSSAVFSYEKPDCVALKDKNSGTSWNHDVRVFKENEFKLLLEITIWTNELYSAIRLALAESFYDMTEDGDDEVISLERAFRRGSI